MVTDINFTRSFVFWHKKHAKMLYSMATAADCQYCNGSKRYSASGEPPMYCICSLPEVLAKRTALLDPYRSEYREAGPSHFRVSKPLDAAFGATMEFMDDPKRWVVLAGRRGVGKTLLARIAATYFGRASLFVTMPEFAGHVSRALRTNTLDEFILYVKTAPILILDEVGGDYSGFEIAVNALQSVISYRDMRPEQFPVFATTNLNQQKLADLGDFGRIFSRLCSKEHSSVVGINDVKDWRTE